MQKPLKIGLFGFLAWLITFMVSVLISPLRTSRRPLFESIMPVVVTGCAVLFAIRYFRDVKAAFLREGIVIGLAWFIINIIIDLPLFMLEGPMRMSFADYMMDVGVVYLIIPAVTIGLGFLARQQAA